MRSRQSPPHLWLMTDERMGDALWTALERLPRASGIIFRHYRTPAAERRRMFERVRSVARRRRLVLVLADSPRGAAGWRADGVHGRSPLWTARPLLRTAPAHHARELTAAMRAGADLVLLSPVFPTRSHPDGRALGPARFGLNVRTLRQGCGHRAPGVIALGGMTAHRHHSLAVLGAYGWAAIDAWTASAAATATVRPLRT